MSPPRMQTPLRAGNHYAALHIKTKSGKQQVSKLGQLTPFKMGRGFLHRAVELGHAELLSFLLERDTCRTGFDLAIRDTSGHTPAYLAATSASHSILQVLANHGA